MKKLRVTVDGKAYDVVVELLDEVATSSAPPPAVAGAASPPLASIAPAAVPIPTEPKTVAAAGDVLSPLAGKVVSVDVQIGQTVAEGAQLAVLEAMKMNTYVFAPRAGRVTAVFVKAGEGVEEGSLVLRLG